MSRQRQQQRGCRSPGRGRRSRGRTSARRTARPSAGVPARRTSAARSCQPRRLADPRRARRAAGDARTAPGRARAGRPPRRRARPRRTTRGRRLPASSTAWRGRRRRGRRWRTASVAGRAAAVAGQVPADDLEAVAERPRRSDPTAPRPRCRATVRRRAASAASGSPASRVSRRAQPWPVRRSRQPAEHGVDERVDAAPR